MSAAGQALCAVAVAALATAGCTIDVQDWQVACGLISESTCRPVVDVALGNLGWRHPARPQGTITIDARGCPVVEDWPEWADASQCWQVVIPLVPNELQACMVIARRAQLGGYGQVAGDAYALPASRVPPQTRGCPK
jgi:hypothetical protein